MKVKIISGAVASLLAIGVLAVVQTIVPVLLLCVVAAIACYEILRTAKVENKAVYGFSMLCAASMPLLVAYHPLEKSGLPLPPYLVLYCMLLLICMLAQYKKTKFEHIAIALYASLFIPFTLSSLILVRDLHKEFPAFFHPAHSMMLVLMGLTSSWMTDTCAYLVGSKLGKHKLAPNISPKKSIEGAIGGVLGNTVVNTIIYFCFLPYFRFNVIRLWMVLAFSVLLSVLSIMGDLSASVIKRNYGQKDFGNLMPGHGGAMDRFDSYTFVMPVVWIIVRIGMCFA